MRQAALGFRVHSGWAALIASSSEKEIVHRSVIRIVDDSIAGAVQPYHSVEHWALAEAEDHLRRCTERTGELARTALAGVIDDLKARGYQVSVCGLLAASGRPLGSLEAILRSHALIHAAEGEFFREAIRHAAEQLGIVVHVIREKELMPGSARLAGMGATEEHLARIGKALGPPWRQDEKLATLAAWLALRL